MQILQSDETWAEATWATADDKGRPVVALSVVGVGGTVIRFNDVDEAETFVEQLRERWKKPGGTHT